MHIHLFPLKTYSLVHLFDYWCIDKCMRDANRLDQTEMQKRRHIGTQLSPPQHAVRGHGRQLLLIGLLERKALKIQGPTWAVRPSRVLNARLLGSECEIIMSNRLSIQAFRVVPLGCTPGFHPWLLRVPFRALWGIRAT